MLTIVDGQTLLYVARGRRGRPYTEGRRHTKEERGNPATRQKEEGTQQSDDILFTFTV